MPVPSSFATTAIRAAIVLAVTIAVPMTSATSARAEAPTEPGVSDEVRAVLAQMGKTMQAKQLSFQAHTLRAYAGPNGELLHIAHAIKAVVRRPDRVLVESSGDDGPGKLLYDGKTLVVYNATLKQYAKVPAPGTIQGMLDVATEKMGIDFPLADLLSDDPETSMVAGVTSGGQVGTAMIDGVECRHFFFLQPPDIELELWLENNDRALPRRVFVTYTSLPGRPTFIAELSDWDLAAHPTDAEFVLQPPAGATEAQMKPVTTALPSQTK
jgi:hypothetical protein